MPAITAALTGEKTKRAAKLLALLLFVYFAAQNIVSNYVNATYNRARFAGTVGVFTGTANAAATTLQYLALFLLAAQILRVWAQPIRLGSGARGWLVFCTAANSLVAAGTLAGLIFAFFTYQDTSELRDIVNALLPAMLLCLAAALAYPHLLKGKRAAFLILLAAVLFEVAGGVRFAFSSVFGCFAFPSSSAGFEYYIDHLAPNPWAVLGAFFGELWRPAVLCVHPLVTWLIIRKAWRAEPEPAPVSAPDEMAGPEAPAGTDGSQSEG